MARDRIIRMIALIALCAMVWYFSFDQGRLTQKNRLDELQKALAGKDRVIAKLGAEIARLKDELKKAGLDERTGDPSGLPKGDMNLRITVRAEASRTLFDGRVVVSCLSIDRPGRRAEIQINMLEAERIVSDSVGLGKGVKFSFDGEEFILVLERIHPSQITAQIIKMRPRDSG